MASPLDPTAGWAALAPAWRRCFELGWEAHRAGSVPVGAVVADPAGRIVAAGRNRFAECAPPVGQLGGSHLAHAEVNALLGLAPGDYEHHVLYTSLEPCLLCTAALIHCHVGEVRYAATDPLWHGIERLPDVNEHVARRWPTRVGPMPGPFAVWAAVLPLLWTLDRSRKRWWSLPTSSTQQPCATWPGAFSAARQPHSSRARCPRLSTACGRSSCAPPTGSDRATFPSGRRSQLATSERT